MTILRECQANIHDEGISRYKSKRRKKVQWGQVLGLNKITKACQGYSQESFEEYPTLTYLDRGYTPQQSSCPTQNYQYCLNSFLFSLPSTWNWKLNAFQNHCKNDWTLIMNNHEGYIQCTHKFCIPHSVVLSSAPTWELGTSRIYQIQRRLSCTSCSTRSWGRIQTRRVHDLYDQLHDAWACTRDPTLC